MSTDAPSYPPLVDEVDLRTPVDEQVDEQRSLGEVVSSLTHDVSELFHTQLELAKVEIREEAAKAAKAGAFGAGAAVMGLSAVLLLGMTVAWGIAELTDPWIGFLVVTVIYAAAAAALGLTAKQRLAQTSVPPQTVETLQEDAQWLQQHRS